MNYLNGADHEYISMQANYLRMLANYYNNPQIPEKKIEPEQEKEKEKEDILERSLRAESVFLSNEHNEDFPVENMANEEISYFPLRENSEEINYNQYPDTNDHIIPQRKKYNSFIYDDTKIAKKGEIKEENQGKNNKQFEIKKTKQLEEEEEIKNNIVTPKRFRKNNLDGEDRPIKSSALSFEQLLERELVKNNPGKINNNSQEIFAPRVKNNKIQKNYPPDEMPRMIVTEKSEKTEQGEKNIKSRYSIEKNENTPKYDYLKKKPSFPDSFSKKNSKDDVSEKTEPDIEKILTPQGSFKRESIKPESTKGKGLFLKRGEGKLCVKSNTVGKNNSLANISKISSSEKSDTFNDYQFSDKEQEIDEDKNNYLNEQIKHYQSENNKLQKLIKEVEEKKKILDKDKHDFFKEREKNLEEFEK